MTYSVLFIELVLNISKQQYENQLGRVSGSEIYETSFGFADESLMEHGIGVAYHSGKKRKVRFIVYPGLVISDDTDELWEPSPANIAKLNDRLNRLIRDYFNGKFSLNDFTLSRIDYAVDIDVGSPEKISEYIKVLKNIGRVKCFSPLKPTRYDKENRSDFFGLRGNTNGVEFRVYGLKSYDTALRVEVSLTRRETMAAYSKETDTDDMIYNLAKSSEHIILDTLRHIVPGGDYYLKQRADELICQRVPNVKLRRKMLRLLALIPEKKSLHLGMKAMAYRNVRELLVKFAEIDVSPVTISKRQGVKKLESLYGLLASE